MLDCKVKYIFTILTPAGRHSFKDKRKSWPFFILLQDYSTETDKGRLLVEQNIDVTATIFSSFLASKYPPSLSCLIYFTGDLILLPRFWNHSSMFCMHRNLTFNLLCLQAWSQWYTLCRKISKVKNQFRCLFLTLPTFQFILAFWISFCLITCPFPSPKAT